MQQVVKEVQKQEITAPTLSLEDELIRALYNDEKEVGSEVLAGQLGISENALFSIVNRIRKSFPYFILIHKGGGKERLLANEKVEKEVRLFLAEGGFTAINEEERRVYDRALVREVKKLNPGKRRANGFGLKKALVLVVVATGAVTLLLKIYKGSKTR